MRVNKGWWGRERDRERGGGPFIVVAKTWNKSVLQSRVAVAGVNLQHLATSPMEDSPRTDML